MTIQWISDDCSARARAERVVPLSRGAFAVGGPEPLHRLALLCERVLELLNTLSGRVAERSMVPVDAVDQLGESLGGALERRVVRSAELCQLVAPGNEPRIEMFEPFLHLARELGLPLVEACHALADLVRLRGSPGGQLLHLRDAIGCDALEPRCDPGELSSRRVGKLRQLDFMTLRVVAPGVDSALELGRDAESSALVSSPSSANLDSWRSVAWASALVSSASSANLDSWRSVASLRRASAALSYSTATRWSSAFVASASSDSSASWRSVAASTVGRAGGVVACSRRGAGGFEP